MTTPLELVQYYANLLIFQYVGLSRAYNTIISSVTPIVMAQQSVQEISFLPVPTSGNFTLSYNGISTSSINWDDTASTIQGYLQSIPGLNSVTVTGSISDGLTVNFVGITGVAQSLIVASNNLLSSSNTVEITILETDTTLPLAVQNAFDLNTAIGIQLDILAKYVGVVRTITTPTQTITLSDSDFITLMKFAIIQNNSGSSMADIENNMNIFFPDQFIITDNKNMTMSYILSESLGSKTLFIYLIQENLIPSPMGVLVNIILIPPDAKNLFGFSTYNGINTSVKPFNTYDDFNTTWIFLSYSSIIAL